MIGYLIDYDKMINLFLIDMTNARSINGVDRYISCLIDGLKQYPDISVHWISLVYDENLIFHRQEHFENYEKVTIPLPQQQKEIINEFFWINKYNTIVYDIIEPLFRNKKNILIHIHTLNLIDLADYIKSKLLDVKIITHIHCIPWKDLYDKFPLRFNRLYGRYYLSDEKCNYLDFITNQSEKRSYDHADKIISGTYCAKEFLRRVMNIPNNKVAVSPNGMNDKCSKLTFKEIGEGPIEFFFVGRINKSKGIFYILQSLRLVQKAGFDVLLHIAGRGLPEEEERISSEFSDVPTHLLGAVPFEKLSQYYSRCHIGLIASLHEQASYTGVEMSMFGMPIITTGVDGLDEMFDDEINALKISTIYTRMRGLSVDVTQMSEKIIELIIKREKRKYLSENARKLYLTRLTATRMVREVVNVYYQTVYG